MSSNYLPAGCGATPGEEDEGPCQLCWRSVDDCVCRACSVCGIAGDPSCLGKHIHAFRGDLESQGYLRGYAAYFQGAKEKDADKIYAGNSNVQRVRYRGWLRGFRRARDRKPLDDSNG